MQATVTSKGQLTLPKAIRDQLGIKPGDKVEFRATGEKTFEIAPVNEPTLDDIIGAFAPFVKTPPLSDEACDDAIGRMLVEDDERIKREAEE